MNRSNNRLLGAAILFAATLISSCPAAAQSSWPTTTIEAKPGTRWWWLGSAVDKENLRWTMQQYADAGIGAVEITPIYGVQGNDQNRTPDGRLIAGKNIPYLSDEWMAMLREVQKNGRELGIEVDMATGTGWPFGGPWVPLEESACKAVFVDTFFVGTKAEGLDLAVPEKDRKYARLSKVMAYMAYDTNPIDVTEFVKDGKLYWDVRKSKKDITATLRPPVSMKKWKWHIIAVYVRHGVMKVKRAAPGGEGLVIDHFDRHAVQHYLQHIEEAFERTQTPYPHTFFNDSYEVSEATWTPSLFDEFHKRRGYKLEDRLPLLLAHDTEVVSDYRETLGDLLLENFTEQWTAWAHSHGAITRNQAHGSPANLIDCYAAVDIPEIEGFGLSDFGIKGLRQDPGKTRKNDSDYSMFKYAPSAAHVCGKPYTSSETFTWLTEHFRTSLSQLKPDLDLMFCAGVNHMFFHGTCYSPKDDPWPGWKFYASIDMSPTNSIWRDAPFFMQYVERCQSFLQWGQPDNDFLVLLPVRDMWRQHPEKLLMQFSIHAMGQLAPDFIQTILDIDRAGFDCDYISERLLMGVTYKDGMLQTAAGTRYRGLIVPGSGQMPQQVKAHIDSLQAQGAHVIIGTDPVALGKAARSEPMKADYGLKAIRRSNAQGHHYFIANLTPHDVEADIPLAVPFGDALLYNPLDGTTAAAPSSNGRVHLSLRSGESTILLAAAPGRALSVPTSSSAPLSFPSSPTSPAAPSSPVPSAAPSSPVLSAATESQPFPLSSPWSLSFLGEAPRVAQTFTLAAPQTWETLGDDSTRVTMGTGVYTTHLQLRKGEPQGLWEIDLGDVRESARVYVNGQFVGCAWSVPFVLRFQGDLLHVGDNELRIEVTNLPANRIADLDRRGVKWRKMEEINVVDINYRKTTYDQWTPMPSGLNSAVTLRRYR